MYPYDQAHALVKSIKESPEYKAVKKQKAVIDNDSRLKKMLTDYRTKQMEVQKLQIMGQQVPQEKMQGFRQLHDIVAANAPMKEFLEAEYRLGAMMTDIQKIMVEGLNLD